MTNMGKKIAGRTTEQWREYAHQAIDAKHKAIEEAQEMMREERVTSKSKTLE